MISHGLVLDDVALLRGVRACCVLVEYGVRAR